jgi:hypothetical protein
MSGLHRMSNYSEFNLPVFSGAFAGEHPRVTDFRAQFDRLAPRGDHLSARDTNLFVAPRDWRYTSVERRRVNTGRNHFQGMQRLRNYVFLSGADLTEPCSHLFVIRLGSRRERGVWGSNIMQQSRPSDQDRVVRVVALDAQLNHPGGISLLGDVLAIPVEGDHANSRVIFLNVADPEEPARFPEDVDIRRSGIPKAGAVALARLPDGRFLCGVWWEDANAHPPGELDLYMTHDGNLFGGFEPEPLVVRFPRVRGRKVQYQAVAFITADDAVAEDADAVPLYMVALENESPSAPTINGVNRADLFAIDFKPWAPGADPRTGSFQVTTLASPGFECGIEHGNFDAAAGIHIEDDGVITLYTGYHWRVNGTFRFAEFRARRDASLAVLDPEDSWIELYEHDGLRGRCLTILGTQEATLQDYSRIFVQGGDFDKAVSSLQYQIAPGLTYRLYRTVRLRGSRPGADFFDLVGTGRLEVVQDLAKDPFRFGDRVMSSRYLPGP